LRGPLTKFGGRLPQFCGGIFGPKIALNNASSNLLPESDENKDPASHRIDPEKKL
jgi:hypothetical protein